MNKLPSGLHELRNDYLHLMVDEETKLLYTKWVRQPSKQEYREGVAILVKCLRKKNVMYWILDSLELKDVPTDDQVWAIREVALVAPQTSLKKIARISTDENYMKKLVEVASQIHSEQESGISVQQFYSYREAAEWIEGKR